MEEKTYFKFCCWLLFKTVVAVLINDKRHVHITSLHKRAMNSDDDSSNVSGDGGDVNQNHMHNTKHGHNEKNQHQRASYVPRDAEKQVRLHAEKRIRDLEDKVEELEAENKRLRVEIKNCTKKYRRSSKEDMRNDNEWNNDERSWRVKSTSSPGMCYFHNTNS